MRFDGVVTCFRCVMLYRINMLSWAGVGGSLAGCWRSFGTVGTVGVFDTVGKFNYALAVTWERVFM